MNRPLKPGGGSRTSTARSTPDLISGSWRKNTPTPTAPGILLRWSDRSTRRSSGKRDARQEYGRAQAAAETAASQYRQRSDERLTDRTSPDVEGFPADREVTVPADADRYAERLDELANEMGNTARAEEQAANLDSRSDN